MLSWVAMAMTQTTLADGRTLNLTRTAVDSLWRRGNLSWLMLPLQLEFDRCYKNIPGHKFLIECSRKVGKTGYEVLKDMEQCGGTPNSRVRFASQTRTELEEVVLPLFDEFLKTCPKDMIPTWVNGRSSWVWPNGSRDRCYGSDTKRDATKLRGPMAHLVLVDEGGFIDPLKYLVDDVLMPQLIPTGGNMIIATTVPDKPAHDIYGYIEQAQAEGWYKSFNIHDSHWPVDKIEEFCKEAGGPQSPTWLREYMCQRIADPEKALCPEWRKEFIVPANRPKLWQFFHKYEGMDIGCNPDFTVVLIGWYDFPRAKLVICDEIMLHGKDMTTKNLAEKVRAKELEHFPDMVKAGLTHQILRWSDNDNKILLQDLAVGQFDPRIKQYVNQMHFAATSKDSLDAMVNKVKIWVNAGRLEVDPRCKQLLGCLEWGTWKNLPSGREFDRSTTYGHFDAFAALMYLIRNVDESTNPIPATHGISEATHHVPSGVEQTGESIASDAAIKSIFT